MHVEPETVDFALDALPGDALHSVLRTARERGPVQATRFHGLPAFVITSHAALARAFQDEESFPGYRMYQSSFEPAIGRSFISEPDAARHLTFRKLTTPAFRARAVASREASGLSALAHELVDRMGDRDEVDLVADFTARFPYLVISRLLGIPRDREEEFHAWALALLTFREDAERAVRARRTLSELLESVIADRRRAPRDDVISELIRTEVDGRVLDDDEIIAHVRLLFPTGGETTHGSLGNVLYALFRDGGDDPWLPLRGGSDRIAAVVDEGLRWETPIAVLPRMSCSTPIVFEDVEIPADSWVLFAIAGANRDPGWIDDPDRFSPGRAQPPGLVFGRGPKSCPGMHLARRNMAVALDVLSTRLPALELVDPEAARPRRTVLRAPEALRVRRR